MNISCLIKSLENTYIFQKVDLDYVNGYHFILDNKFKDQGGKKR